MTSAFTYSCLTSYCSFPSPNLLRPNPAPLCGRQQHGPMVKLCLSAFLSAHLLDPNSGSKELKLSRKLPKNLYKSPFNSPFYCTFQFSFIGSIPLFHFCLAWSNSINTFYLPSANAVQLHTESHPAHYQHSSPTQGFFAMPRHNQQTNREGGGDSSMVWLDPFLE